MLLHLAFWQGTRNGRSAPRTPRADKQTDGVAIAHEFINDISWNFQKYCWDNPRNIFGKPVWAMNHDAIERFRSSRRSQKYSSSIFPRPAAHPRHFTENFRSVGMIYLPFLVPLSLFNEAAVYLQCRQRVAISGRNVSPRKCLFFSEICWIATLRDIRLPRDL